MATSKMNAADAVFGGLGECYITISGNRYNMMQLTKFESSVEVKLADVKVLGNVMSGKKPAGTTGKWSATAHFNQSVIRKWLLDYKKTGKLAPMTIQVINNDPSSAAGTQKIVLYGCYPDKSILAKLEAGDNILEEDISGTFNDWDMPTQFKTLKGMK